MYLSEHVFGILEGTGLGGKINQFSTTFKYVVPYVNTSHF
jgi:hypothetical protein